MISKSLAGVAAGVLLVGGGALATAQADPSSPDNVTAGGTVERSATAQATRSANAYPSSVFTRTNVRIKRTIVRGHGRASIVVTAGAVDRKPRGDVRLVVDGKSRREELRRGEAVVRLPRGLRAGRSYTARVTYLPTRGSQFQRSSDSDRFRVVRRSR
jgi:hypothetical protein